MEKSTVQLKMTRSGRHSTTPLSALSSYDNKNRACSSRVMELPKVAENSLRFASEKEHWTESENNCIQFSDHWYFRTLHLESYSSRSKQFRNTKIVSRSEKGLYYLRKSPPTYGNLYVWRTRVRLYLLSEYTLLTLRQWELGT